jgi:hypothetical protein
MVVSEQSTAVMATGGGGRKPACESRFQRSQTVPGPGQKKKKKKHAEDAQHKELLRSLLDEPLKVSNLKKINCDLLGID